jgi:acyl carrier protein
MPVSRTQLETDILQFVQARSPNHEGLTVQTDLLEDGILDSLLLVDLIFEIEDRAGVRLGSDQVSPAHFRTVSAIADLALGTADSGSALA